MPRPRWLPILLLTVTLCGCREQPDGEIAIGDWSYLGETGPEAWAELDPAYAQCAGEEQSPIDIKRVVDEAPSRVSFRYGGVTPRLVNDGREIRVEVDGGEVLRLGSGRYELDEFHFRNPSEHRVQGRLYPAEIQLLHTSSDGWRAGVAVFVEEGEPSAAVASLWEHLPLRPGEEISVVDGSLDLMDLIPRNRVHYLYPGSLTRPPCTEAVRWIVFAEPIEMSREQLNVLRAAHTGNSRPAQPRNRRRVEVGVAD